MKVLSLGGLRGRMALIVLAAVMFISALMLAVYLKERKLIRAHMEDDLLQLAGIIANDQSEFISQTRQLLLALSKVPEAHSPGTDACPDFLSDLVAEFVRYADIGLVDPSGNVRCSATRMLSPVNLSGEPWFRHAVESRDYSIGSFNAGTKDDLALTLGYPIYSETGGLESVVYATVDLAHFEQFISPIRPPREVEFMLVTQRGVIVSRQAGAEVHLEKTRGKELLLQAMFRRGGGTIELDADDGIERLYAFAPLCSSVDTGLHVAVGVPVATLFRAANRMVATQFAGLWIVTLIAVFLIWFGSSAFIIRPLHAVAETAKRLSSGETTARTCLPHRDDEIGLMAKAFDDMAETLEKRGIELRRQQDQLRSFASQLSVAEERERRSIATDLHDRVGQLLALARMKLGMLRQAEPSPEARELAEEMSGFLAEAIRETRSLIFEISPPILYELGLEAALDYLAEQGRKQYGIAVSYKDDGSSKPLAEDVKILLYRAAGELLRNAAKHSGASRIRLSSTLKALDIVLQVEDDGAGFDPGAVGSNNGKMTGYGLFSIRERIDCIGGRMEIDSRPGTGTRITLTVPVEPGERDGEDSLPPEPQA